MEKKGQVHILFLGAGASCDAGYPLTQNLFEELENYCKSCCDKSITQKWKDFEELREVLSQNMGVLAKSRNPEFILTLPDLLSTSADDYSFDIIESIDRDLASNKSIETDKIKNFEEIPSDEKIEQSKKMKYLFESVLEHYFLMKHWKDSERKLPTYLGCMLHSANIVITTNWDTLAERRLLAEEKWFPSDGYGFTIELEEYLDGLKKGNQKYYPFSKIKVLKLHGSIGWHKKNDGVFYLSNIYLKYLMNGVCDSNAPYAGIGADEGSVMLYPSYLKQLNNPILLSIWEQAQKALEAASSVTVVGYSLPKADGAIRALLLPLRTNPATIRIVSPSSQGSEANKRWVDYFESSRKQPEFIYEKADKYFDLMR